MPAAGLPGRAGPVRPVRWRRSKVLRDTRPAHRAHTPMNHRLQAELQRLYGTHDPTAPGAAGGPGEVPAVRALVLELGQAAGWDELSNVWRGVQVDLDLPAPAIAVSGRAGYQLWFSLAEPVAPFRAAAFLAALCRRYLAEVPPERIRLIPAAGGDGEMPMPPPAQVADERWSAFVAPDLAPVFADEPWLDRPPGEEAQAELLSRFEPTGPEAFLRAFAQLAATDAPPSVPPPSPPARAEGAQAGPSPGHAADPRRFLLDVMNDPAVDMQWRIEAAKALLPYVDRDDT